MMSNIRKLPKTTSLPHILVHKLFTIYVKYLEIAQNYISSADRGGGGSLLMSNVQKLRQTTQVLQTLSGGSYILMCNIREKQ